MVVCGVDNGCWVDALTYAVCVECYFFFNDAATTTISNRSLVRSVSAVEETGLNIKVNGSTKASGNYKKQANDDHSLILSAIVDLSAGDTVLATYFTYAGGNSTIYSNSNYTGGTCIDIFKIAT